MTTQRNDNDAQEPTSIADVVKGAVKKTATASAKLAKARAARCYDAVPAPARQQIIKCSVGNEPTIQGYFIARAALRRGETI
jgi:hypothetical protein